MQVIHNVDLTGRFELLYWIASAQTDKSAFLEGKPKARKKKYYVLAFPHYQ
jgi:hypothetical protein